MGKCKNIECNDETLKGRVYCSLTCRNIYVNKYLRDYTKNSEGLSKKDEYLLNPKKCGYCGDNLPHNKRYNKYCDSSCAAKISNPNRVGIKYELSDGGLKSLRESALRLSLTTDKINDYNNNPNTCKNCKSSLEYGKRKNVYCGIECRRDYEKVNIDGYRRYRLDCKFNFSLNQFPDEFDFGLIEEHGWYSPSNSNKSNINGVSRDHIYSVSEAYKQGVDPEIISHPANCRLMIHSDNIGKGGNCGITIEELKHKIKKWDKKYK